MRKQEDDCTNNGMKGTDMLNGAEDGLLINYCGKCFELFCISYFV
jgi:hypothetical protein